MKNSNTLGPDGFFVDFYLVFYELIKDGILKLVIELQSSRKVMGSLNSTFLCLIPKPHKTTSFFNFQPIGYGNLIYKLISKIISRRINLVLISFILEERFGFLQKKNICDIVVGTQEVFHSAKVLN